MTIAVIVFHVKTARLVQPGRAFVRIVLPGNERLKIQPRMKHHVYLAKVVGTNQQLEKMIVSIALLESTN